MTRRHLVSVLQRLGFFQIDSVSVLKRAHFMPAYSRCGPYDDQILLRAAEKAPRAMFEYWTHMAALTDVSLWPALRHRMASGEGMWGRIREVGQNHPDLVAALHDRIAEHGPATAAELAAHLEPPHDNRRDHWGWNWSTTKAALEYLFHRGEVTTAWRTSSFERVYDLPERVLPAAILAMPALDERQAHRHLVDHAVRALGIATEASIRDYFRMRPAPTRTAIAELVSSGIVDTVDVSGWARPAFLHREAPAPRPVNARTLLSPFDPLVFDRQRTEELFGFRYRLEIYVPEAKRVHGYYVLPFLLGEDLVARVDLKADRASGRLVVAAAHAEPAAPADTPGQLFAELQVLAGWLGLTAIEIREAGNLAGPLRVTAGD